MLLSRLLLHHFNLSQKFLYENTFCALYFGRKSWCFPPERHTLFRSSSLGLIHLHHQIYATGFLVRAAVLGDAYLLPVFFFLGVKREKAPVKKSRYFAILPVKKEKPPVKNSEK